MALSGRAAPAYAGFWVRFGAGAIDLVVVVGALALVQLLISLFAIYTVMSIAGFYAVTGLNVVMIFVPAWLYFAVLESSTAGATLGKQTLGLAVRGAADGGRISFTRASVRWFARWPSLVPFLLGFLIQPITRRRQALHDLAAGTVVVSVGEHGAAGAATAVVATILIGSALAAPAWLDPVLAGYTMRSRVAEAMLAAYATRTAIEAYLLAENRLPPSLEELGASFQPGYGRTLAYDRQTGALTITLDKAPLRTKTVLLTPERVGPQAVRWRCSSPDVPLKYLPETCRE